MGTKEGDASAWVDTEADKEYDILFPTNEGRLQRVPEVTEKAENQRTFMQTEDNEIQRNSESVDKNSYDIPISNDTYSQ